MLQGLIKFTLKLTRRHLGLSFQKNCPFGCSIVDATPKGVTMWALANEKYMLNKKGDFAYDTLHLQWFLASEK